MIPVLSLSLSNLFGRIFAFFMDVCILLSFFTEYRPSGLWGASVEFDVIVMALFGSKILGRFVIILRWNVI